MPAFSLFQRKTVMSMTLDAFHTWRQHLRLSSETEVLVASIRSSPPTAQSVVRTLL